MLFSGKLNFWFSSLHFPNLIRSFSCLSYLGFWAQGWLAKDSGKGSIKPSAKETTKSQKTAPPPPEPAIEVAPSLLRCFVCHTGSNHPWLDQKEAKVVLENGKSEASSRSHNLKSCRAAPYHSCWYETDNKANQQFLLNFFKKKKKKPRSLH